MIRKYNDYFAMKTLINTKMHKSIICNIKKMLNVNQMIIDVMGCGLYSCTINELQKAIWYTKHTKTNLKNFKEVIYG
jgi:hypothetical protein